MVGTVDLTDLEERNGERKGLGEEAREATGCKVSYRGVKGERY